MTTSSKPMDPNDEELLVMWSIYDHPSDYPNHFVARRWLIAREGPRPTTDVLVADGIDRLRTEFHQRGLYCQPREPGDDPAVVETWF